MDNNNNDNNYDYETGYNGENRCLVCGIDMGYCNPRQLCMKTYCPEELYSSESEDNISYNNNE